MGIIVMAFTTIPQDMERGIYCPFIQIPSWKSEQKSIFMNVK
jgi:hypothetical protein